MYKDIVEGRGDHEKWLSYATILWNDIRDGKQEITRFDLERRAHAMNHEPGLSYELYTKLDASGDSTITQDEVELLVQRLGHQLNLRTLAQRGINSILRKLDIIMLILVIAIILIIFCESS